MAPHVLIHVHFCRPILATNHTWNFNWWHVES
jgi:hypothetical protein